jgi:pimeloyl-ACP methyl ester carboxylesterase
MPPSDVPIETGALPSGHPYAQIGNGSRVVLSIPGLSFTHEPAKPASVRRSWKRWLEPIDRQDLTFVEVGRRADLPPGSMAPDIADDYASVIRQRWGSGVGVMGVSTGGGYAQWLASRHPELVERLVLGFTGHRIPADVTAYQRGAVDHFLAGRWRSGYQMFAAWVMPKHARLAGAAFWLLGPYIAGRPSDLRVLRIDGDSDDRFDGTAALPGIRCPTLVISGGLDLAYPPELTNELVGGIRDARHIEYADVGHGFGAGARFAEDACAFLAGAGSSREPSNGDAPAPAAPIRKTDDRVRSSHEAPDSRSSDPFDRTTVGSDCS